MLRNVNYSTSQPFLIRAAWVYTACSPAIRRGALLINGNKIEAVLSEAESDSSSTSIIDMGDAVITPGLFNLHTHLDYSAAPAIATGLPLFDWMAALVASTRGWSPADFQASARQGAEQAARNGTTFIVDSSYSGLAAEALAVTGLKGIVGLELFGLDEERSELVFSFWLKRYAQLHDTASSALQEATENKRIVTTIAPHAPYTVCPGLWKLAAQWASSRNLLLTAHLAESIEELHWLAHSSETLDNYLGKVMPPNPAKTVDQLLGELKWKGHNQTVCAHLQQHGLLDSNLLAAHCIHINDSDIALLKKSGARAALCRRSNERLLTGAARRRRLQEEGVPFGLGTDSLASNSDLSMLKEAASWRHDSLSADDCMRLITIEAACAVDRPDCGSLAPGQAADLAIFPLSGNKELSATDLADHLLDEAPEAESLMVDGRFVIREGKLLT
jgi:cytosine/adenosine deaminase-related metal-dependent hydrolase